MSIIRKKILRLLLCDYQRAAVTILYIGLSSSSRLTTLRLFHDYFRSCYDYSGRSLLDCSAGWSVPG
nr:MAG TPA: hypothetical protein [Caudoviricetes sp.]